MQFLLVALIQKSTSPLLKFPKTTFPKRKNPLPKVSEHNCRKVFSQRRKRFRIPMAGPVNYRRGATLKSGAPVRKKRVPGNNVSLRIRAITPATLMNIYTHGTRLFRARNLNSRSIATPHTYSWAREIIRSRCDMDEPRFIYSRPQSRRLYRGKERNPPRQIASRLH